MEGDGKRDENDIVRERGSQGEREREREPERLNSVSDPTQGASGGGCMFEKENSKTVTRCHSFTNLRSN